MAITISIRTATQPQKAGRNEPSLRSIIVLSSRIRTKPRARAVDLGIVFGGFVAEIISSPFRLDAARFCRVGLRRRLQRLRDFLQKARGQAGLFRMIQTA